MQNTIAIKELENISKKWDIKPNSIQLLKQYKHFIFSLETADGSYILRLDKKNETSLDILNSQLYFSNYLYNKKLKVPVQLVSKSNNVFEKISVNNINYLASIQKKIPYPKLTIEDFSCKQTIEMLGKTIGTLHQLSKEHNPPPQFRACPKHTDILNKELKSNHSQAALEQIKIAKQKLHEIPISPETYGLIHSDLHPGNLLKKDNTIAILDFDLCCYAWYIYDVAILLIYVDKNLQELFIESYKQQTNLEDSLMQYIPLCQAIFNELINDYMKEKR